MKKLVLMVLIACFVITSTCAEYFPCLTVVIDTEEISSDVWAVICIDKEGNEWAFYGVPEDWEVGDVANLLFYQYGENFDDWEIIEVSWEGYVEDIGEFFQIFGWGA